MIELSIIIVNWNTRAILLDCLSSIYAHPPQVRYDIWVVDNASQDGSVAAVQAAYPAVRLIANTENRGFAAANNQAIRASTGRFVLLLNSDTLVLEQALERLVACLANHQSVGIVGAHLLNQDGSLQPSWAAFPTIWSEVRGINVRRATAYPANPELQLVDWVGGAALLIRRSAIDQVGLMDEAYFMYAEETDWCYRVKQAGWHVCYCQSARIIHLGGQSSKRASVRMKTELFRSKLRFFRKHYGRPHARLLQVLIQGGLFLKAGFGSMLRYSGGQRAEQGAQLQKESFDVLRGIGW